MKNILVLLVGLLLAGLATADVTVDAPASADQYTLVRMSAKGDIVNSGLLWRVYDPNGKRLAAASVWSKDSKCVFTGPPGDYHIELLILRIDDKTKAPVLEEVEKTVTIKGVVPPPIPPGPVDPLTQALQLAYSTETDTSKAVLIKQFAALYRQAAADDLLAKCDTWGALYDTISTASKSLNIWGKLMSVQGVVQIELKGKLPTKRDDPLTQDGRALAATTFRRIAASLEGVK